MASYNDFSYKEFLLNNYKDLVFVDDIEHLTCNRCDRVLIHNYKANCGHHFCRNCQRVFSDGKKWNCPKCNATITDVTENDVEIERKVQRLKIQCINKVYGCPETMTVTELKTHLEKCENTKERNLPALYIGTNSVPLMMEKLGKMLKELGAVQQEVQELKQNERSEINIGTFDQKIKDLSTRLNEHIKQCICLKNERQYKNVKKKSNQLDQTQNKHTTSDMDDQTNFENRNSKNILLLGESGSGKSTFINAVASFYRNKSFEEAKSSKCECVIPTKMSVTDENYKEIVVEQQMNDPNESLDPDQSNTRKCRSYLFHLGANVATRFIDSPGFASSWGPDYDDESVNGIVNYVRQYVDLHAVGIIIKGNQSTLTTKFEYWLQLILAMLPKTAIHNIAFIFNFGNKPGDSFVTLNKGFKEIKNKLFTPVPLLKANVYSFENEGLSIIEAIKQGIAIDEENEEISKSNWEASKQEFNRMMEFVENLKPFYTNEIIEINDAAILLSQVVKVNEQVGKDLEYNEVKRSRCQKNDTKLNFLTDYINSLKDEKFLLEETINKICIFNVNKAILCTNFKRQDYLNECHADGNYKAEDTNGLILKFYEPHLNSPTAHLKTLNFADISSLKLKIIEKSISGSKCGYVYQTHNYKKIKKNYEVDILCTNM